MTTITTTCATTAPHGFGTSGLGGPEVSGLGHWDKGIAVVSDDSGYNSDDGDEFHNGDGDGRDDRGLDGGGVLRRRVAQLLLPRPILHVSATVQFASMYISYGRVALKRFHGIPQNVVDHNLCHWGVGFNSKTRTWYTTAGK